MKKRGVEEHLKQIEAQLGFRPCAPTGVVARIGDKWTIMVMSNLAIAPGHKARFSTLKNSIEGITQRMLTLTLRNLERDGLLVRHYFPEVPPRVEYELTDMGAGMLPALEGFTSWIRDNWPRMEACRRSYDEAQSNARYPS
jgi:DNA-binding HxlR family transcriptional regulator